MAHATSSKPRPARCGCRPARLAPLTAGRADTSGCARAVSHAAATSASSQSAQGVLDTVIIGWVRRQRRGRTPLRLWSQSVGSSVLRQGVWPPDAGQAAVGTRLPRRVTEDVEGKKRERLPRYWGEGGDGVDGTVANVNAPRGGTSWRNTGWETRGYWRARRGPILRRRTRWRSIHASLSAQGSRSSARTDCP